MAYIDELRSLLEQAEERLGTCDSDAAYASILRQVRGLKSDIHAIEGEQDGDEMGDILDGGLAVR